MSPTECVVKSGPLEGAALYINSMMPLFKSMHEGDYDSFFWEYLAEEEFEGGTVLEVGGHIGYHALAFARMVGEDGKVCVFEPNPFNRERLRINLDLNPNLSGRVLLQENAVGDEDAELAFSFSENVDDETSSGGFLSGSERNFSSKAYAKFVKKTVRCVTLDHFVRINNIHDVSLIKIDVEGAEGLVLDGAGKLIMQHRPTLMIEIHSVTAMDHVYRTLDRMNYSVEVLSVDSGSRCFVGSRPRK